MSLNFSSDKPYEFIDTIVANVVTSAVETVEKKTKTSLETALTRRSDGVDQGLKSMVTGCYDAVENDIKAKAAADGATEAALAEWKTKGEQALKQAPERLRALSLPSCYDSLSFHYLIPLQLIRFFQDLEARTKVLPGARSFFVRLMSWVENAPCHVRNQRIMTIFLQRLNNKEHLQDPSFAVKGDLLRPFLATAFFANDTQFSTMPVSALRGHPPAGAATAGAVVAVAASVIAPPSLPQEIFGIVEAFSKNVLVLFEDVFSHASFLQSSTKDLKDQRRQLRNKPAMFAQINEAIGKIESYFKKLTVISSIYFGRKRVLADQMAQIAQHLRHPTPRSPLVIRYLTNQLKSTVSLLKTQVDEAYKIIANLKEEQALDLRKEQEEEIAQKADIYSINVKLTEAEEKSDNLAHNAMTVSMTSSILKMGRLVMELGFKENDNPTALATIRADLASLPSASAGADQTSTALVSAKTNQSLGLPDNEKFQFMMQMTGRMLQVSSSMRGLTAALKELDASNKRYDQTRETIQTSTALARKTIPYFYLETSTALVSAKTNQSFMMQMTGRMLQVSSSMRGLTADLKELDASNKRYDQTRETNRERTQRQRQELLRKIRITPQQLRALETNLEDTQRLFAKYHCHVLICKEGVDVWERLLKTYEEHWLGVAPPDVKEIDLDLLWPMLIDATPHAKHKAERKVQVEEVTCKMIDLDELLDEHTAAKAEASVVAAPQTVSSASVNPQTYSEAFDKLSRVLVYPSHRSSLSPLSQVCLKDANYHFRLFGTGLDLLQECRRVPQAAVLRPLMRHFVRTSATMMEQHFDSEILTKASVDDLNHSHVAQAAMIGFLDTLPADKQAQAKNILAGLDYGVVSVRYPHSTRLIYTNRREVMPATLQTLLNPETAEVNRLAHGVVTTFELMQMRGFSSHAQAIALFARIAKEFQQPSVEHHLPAVPTAVAQELQKSLQPSLEVLRKLTARVESIGKADIDLPIFATVCAEIKYHMIGLQEAITAWIAMPRTRYLPLFGDLILLHAQVLDEQIQAAIYIKNNRKALYNHDLENYRVLNGITETAANAQVVAGLNTFVGVNYPHRSKLLYDSVPQATTWRLKALEVGLYGNMYDVGDTPGQRRVTDSPEDLRRSLITIINGVVGMAREHIKALSAQ